VRNAIKFLKFDLRMIKANSKQSLLIAFIPFVALSFSKYSDIFELSYLLLFVTVLGAIPFNFQGNEKSKEMYSMLPAKIYSMVLGRFIYLLCSTLSMFIIVGIYIWYLYGIGKIQEFEIIAICLSALVSLIVCFIQYPLYYKIGTENMRIISTMIYIIPGIFVYSLPNIFRKNFNLNIGSSITLVLISLLIAAILGVISYLISYKVCKNKEI
jgi:hypothetical protein